MTPIPPATRISIKWSTETSGSALTDDLLLLDRTWDAGTICSGAVHSVVMSSLISAGQLPANSCPKTRGMKTSGGTGRGMD